MCVCGGGGVRVCACVRVCVGVYVRAYSLTHVLLCVSACTHCVCVHVHHVISDRETCSIVALTSVAVDEDTGSP